MDREREERIKERAHEIWEREGRQDGSHEANWQRAEGELADEDQEGQTEPSDDRPRVGEASADEKGKGASRRKR
jgi:hypothetical protein